MFIVLNPHSDLPLYEQILNEIKAKILSGELKPGSPLPSIRQLAADLLISVITTKRAYQELEAGGFIETRPGKGTFVGVVTDSSAVDRRFDELRGELCEAVKTGLRIGLTAQEIRKLFEQILDNEVVSK